MKHLEIWITGRVQKVGFRFSAMSAAYKCGVTGFVQNRRDGTVYIEAEGEEENLAKFVSWCRTGPLGSQVSNAEVTTGEMKNFTSFDIRRSSEVVSL